MDTIGVFDASWLLGKADIKQSALLFDKLAIVELNSFLSFRGANLPIHFRKEVEWLQDKRLVFDPKIRALNEHQRASKFYELLLENDESFDSKSITELEKSADKMSKRELRVRMAEIMAEIYAMTINRSRIVSLILRDEQALDAFPIWDDINRVEKILLSGDSKTQVVNVILKALPFPSNDTPWEKIIEFKSDEDTRIKFRRLRLWVSQIAKDELSPLEIQDKIETLVYDYETHMNLHKIKYHTSTFQTILITSAEIIENLAKLQFSKIANNIFELKNHKLNLLGAELNAPGRELAFIAKARTEFK